MKTLLITILLTSILTLTSCSTLNPLDPNQKIRVYSTNRRLTGYNSAFDVPLIFFSTNQQYYIILKSKTDEDK
jgi:hypothetical protein